MIIAFEILEAARSKHFLKKGGILLVNDTKILPMPCISGGAEYPEGLKEKMLEEVNKTYFIPAQAYAEEAGSPKASNVVMLGALCRLFDFDKDVMLRAVKECVPAKFLDVNLKAFEIGYKKVI